MKRVLVFVFVFALVAIARAEDPLAKPILAPEQTPATASKSVEVVLARNERRERATKFTSDLPKIRAYWKGRGLEAGDRIGVVWFAKEVGIAPKDSEITRAATTAYKSDDDGVFALARPKEGWPLGKYACEIYLNGKLTDAIEFTIEKGAEIELH
jgi:hypothetical protein